jgi:hypothetical protein
MRLVVFGSSIVSDLGNPIATSARPILASLAAMGHDAVFLEERSNPWLMALLQTRGLAPVRAFEAAYPTIQHRTYDIPRGLQWTVQFAQHVGTADVIVALPGSPEPVLDQIGAFHSASVVRAVSSGAASPHADLLLGPVGQRGGDATFGPAVAVRPALNGIRTDLAVVAYDAETGMAAANALLAFNPRLVDQTQEKLRGWSFVPEVDLPPWFERRETAVVAGNWRDPLTWARLLLPLASGCGAVAIGPGAKTITIPGVAAVENLSGLPAVIREFSHNDMVSPILDQFDASRQVRDLLGVLRQAYDQKRRARR